MTDANSLVLENLHKKWSHLTLEASFHVNANERIAIVGRSGAGKSSLLRLIAGLEKLDQGRLLLKGRNLSDLPPEKRAIGFLFQDHALFPSMNVIENVAFGLKMRGQSAQERRENALKWLERVGLKKRADDPVEQLSGVSAKELPWRGPWRSVRIFCFWTSHLLVSILPSRRI